MVRTVTVVVVSILCSFEPGLGQGQSPTTTDAYLTILDNLPDVKAVSGKTLLLDSRKIASWSQTRTESARHLVRVVGFTGEKHLPSVIRRLLDSEVIGGLATPDMETAKRLNRSPSEIPSFPLGEFSAFALSGVLDLSDGKYEVTVMFTRDEGEGKSPRLRNHHVIYIYTMRVERDIWKIESIQRIRS
jgi:hypothetical protein